MRPSGLGGLWNAETGRTITAEQGGRRGAVKNFVIGVLGLDGPAGALQRSTPEAAQDGVSGDYAWELVEARGIEPLCSRSSIFASTCLIRGAPKSTLHPESEVGPLSSAIY